jgi:hypothetical protein
LVVWLTRPPSAEKLYTRAKAAVEKKDAESALDATGRYLSRYGSLTDAPTRQVRDWDRTLRVEQRERQLHNRFDSKFNLKPDDDGQKLGYEALRRENEGDVEGAAAKWRELEKKYRDDPDADAAVYTWLAQKKLADLAKLPAREQRLAAELDRQHALVPPERKDDPDDAERESLEAMRAQAFGDWSAARDRWEKFADQNAKDLDARPWAVLAAANARKMKAVAAAGKDKEKEFRLQLLRAKMAEAAAVQPDADPNQRRQAVAIYRDVVALYGSDADPQVSAVARQAAERLRALERK